MADARRLIELGMVPELAKEVAAQIQAVASSVSGLTAADVAFVAAGNIAATDVQAALEELDTEKVAV
jgi:hypothetical protein